MAERNIGELRELDRYHGDPKTRSGAGARKSLDSMLTSDKKYMDDAVKDTGRLLQKTGQRSADKVARRTVARKTSRGGSR